MTSVPVEAAARSSAQQRLAAAPRQDLNTQRKEDEEEGQLEDGAGPVAISWSPLVGALG